jgi:multiple sugar transport system substrate-binding protein
MSGNKGRVMAVSLKALDKMLVGFVLVIVIITIFVKVNSEQIQEISGNSGTALVFAHYWQKDTVKTALKKLADEFENQNPGITIVLRDYSYAEIQHWFLEPSPETGADRKEKDFFAADVFTLDPRWLSEIIQNASLEPLVRYVAGTAFSPAAPSEETPSERVVEPKARFEEWAIPLVSNIALLFYNIDVLKAAGFDRPPKNWTDFKKYAGVLSSPGRYGITLALEKDNSSGFYPEIYPWIWASGAKMFNKGAPDFENRLLIDTFTFFNELRQKGLIAPGIPSDSFSKTRAQKIKEFISGKAAMMVASVEDIDTIRKQMGDTSFGVSTIPSPDNYAGKPVFGVTSTYAGIGSRSKHKDEAWAFISFLAEHSPALSATLNAIPGIGNPLPATLEGNPFYTKAYDMYEIADEVQEFIGVARVNRLDLIVAEEVSKMFEQGQSVEKTASSIQNRWQTELQ